MKFKKKKKKKKKKLAYIVPKTLRKHAYSNILTILLPKNENFQIKNSDIFYISARRGGSNEYLQSMFWAEIRKIMYTPINFSFTI